MCLLPKKWTVIHSFNHILRSHSLSCKSWHVMCWLAQKLLTHVHKGWMKLFSPHSVLDSWSVRPQWRTFYESLFNLSLANSVQSHCCEELLVSDSSRAMTPSFSWMPWQIRRTRTANLPLGTLWQFACLLQGAFSLSSSARRVVCTWS